MLGLLWNILGSSLTILNGCDSPLSQEAYKATSLVGQSIIKIKI